VSGGTNLEDLFALMQQDNMQGLALRIGKIEEADYGAARVRVRLSPEIVTDWIPWAVRRAGLDQEWWAPDVGEQVIVMSPSGNASTGVVWGAIYSSEYRAGGGPGAMVWTFRDGAAVQYNPNGHMFAVDLSGVSGASVMIELLATPSDGDGMIRIKTSKGNVIVQAAGGDVVVQAAGGDVVVQGDKIRLN
jgi:phage baseplate assembly protein V